MPTALDSRRTLPIRLGSRRSFLAALPALLFLVGDRRPWLLMRRQPPAHPNPRPGIDASRVMPREKLADHPRVAAVFDLVREIPEVVDGIRCHCGCDAKVFRSLLSCYEGPDAMAQECHVCQTQAQLAHKMHRAGKTLDDIRVAIDAKFS